MLVFSLTPIGLSWAAQAKPRDTVGRVRLHRAGTPAIIGYAGDVRLIIFYHPIDHLPTHLTTDSPLSLESPPSSTQHRICFPPLFPIFFLTGRSEKNNNHQEFLGIAIQTHQSLLKLQACSLRISQQNEFCTDGIEADGPLVDGKGKFRIDWIVVTRRHAT